MSLEQKIDELIKLFSEFKSLKVEESEQTNTEEPVKESVKESVKEPVKELVKEPIKEPVKESVKELLNEPRVHVFSQMTPFENECSFQECKFCPVLILLVVFLLFLFHLLRIFV